MRHERVVILGREHGITGQLAKLMMPEATLLIQGKPSVEVSDRNFGTQYLWNDIPELETKKITVHTTVDGRTANEKSVRRYKAKIGKEGDMSNWGLQFKEWTTGYEIERVPQMEGSICYGDTIDVDINHNRIYVNWTPGSGYFLFYDWLINTVSLPSFATMARLQSSFAVETIFKSEPIYIWVVPMVDELVKEKNVDFMNVNYISDPSVPWYREAERREMMHYESLQRDIPKLAGVLHDIMPTRVLRPGKIWTCPEVDGMKQWLMENGVACFGRYGAWFPDELLHETYSSLKSFMEGVRR